MEYGELLESGKTYNEIRTVTSKHLITFYNNLIEGNINISKDDFEKIYSEGKELKEIAKIYNISRENITFLRDFYGIKRKGAKYQNRIKNEKSLSPEAISIIIGSLLGDGHINKYGYFSGKHSEKQLGYLKWKASFLKNISSENPFNYYEYKDKRWNIITKSHCFRTNVHSFFYKMREKFYKKVNGKWIKVIDDSMFDLINEMSLAVWFMDDGITDWNYRRGIKKSNGARPSISLCTDSFLSKDIDNLLHILKTKFNIIGYVKNDGQNRIKLNTDNSEKFINITKKYSHPDLSYKFFEEDYLKKIAR